MQKLWGHFIYFHNGGDGYLFRKNTIEIIAIIGNDD